MSPAQKSPIFTVPRSTEERRLGFPSTWNGTSRVGRPTCRRSCSVKVTDSWQQRLVLGLTGMVKGEAIFYPRIRPLVDIEAPEGYYGAHDEKSWRSIAIMENIVETKGARFFCRRWSRPIALVIEDLLADLAAMHGRFWCHPELARSGLRDSFNLISWSDSLVSLRPRSHVGVDRAAAAVPREIADRTDDIYDANFRTLQLDRSMCRRHFCTATATPDSATRPRPDDVASVIGRWSIAGTGRGTSPT